MKISKFSKSIALAAAALLTVATATSANAAVWQPTAADTLDKTTYAVTTSENFAFNQGYSTLFNTRKNDVLCETIGAGLCASTSTDTFSGSFVLPVCTDAADALCLESVNIYSGAKKAATLIRQIDAPVVKVADSVKATLPDGGATTLWNAPGVNHAGNASTYAVSVEVQVDIVKGKVSAKNFSAVVNPYVEVIGDYAASRLTGSGSTTSIDDFSQIQCAYTENAKCGELYDFAANTRVGLAIRVTKSTNSFLSGRLKAPTVSVTKGPNASTTVIKVDAAPVTVQQVSVKLPVAGAPKNLTFGAAPRPKFDYQLDSVLAATALRPLVKDKATGSRTFFTFNNIDDRYVDLTAPTSCKAASGVRGLIASDALIADTFVPTKKGGALKQQLTGLKTNANGTAGSASFDLVLASDYARCLFGLPKSGTVKVAASVATAAKGTGFKSTAKDSAGWASVSIAGIKTTAAVTAEVKLTR